jgi:hypothetical protein
MNRLFKVGDIVRVVRSCSGSIVGKIYKVVNGKIFDDPDILYIRTGKNGGCSCTNLWRLVTPKSDNSWLIASKQKTIKLVLRD